MLIPQVFDLKQNPEKNHLRWANSSFVFLDRNMMYIDKVMMTQHQCMFFSRNMRSFSLAQELQSYDATVKLLPASPEIFSHVAGFS